MKIRTDAFEPQPYATWTDRQRLLAIGAVFLVAFLFRYVIVTLMPRPLSTDLYWNDAVGWNLAQGRGFTASLTGYIPAIFRSPGYPALLAVIYKIFGHSIHAALVVNAVLDSLTAVLTLLMGWRLLGFASGCVAGFLYALYPYPAIFCATLHQDMLLTLSCVLILFFTLRAQDEPTRFGRWLFIGLLIGLALMVKPFIAPYALVPAIIAFISPQLSFLKKIRAVAAMAVLALLVVSPWVARNYYHFHAFFPLAVGGSGDGMGTLLEEIRGGEGIGLTTGIGEVQTREQSLATVVEGQQLLDEERADTKRYAPQLLQIWPRVLRVTLMHIPRLWISRYASGYSRSVALVASAMGWLVLIFGLIGMYLLRARWRAFLAIYSTIVVITLLYSPIPIEARYTLPAKPAMLLFVTAALMFFYQRVRRKTHAPAAATV